MDPLELGTRFLNWFCLKGWGYQFWSGIGGTFFTPFLLLVGFYRHHNCHVRWCLRVGHVDPECCHPACKRHHSKRAELGEPPPGT